MIRFNHITGSLAGSSAEYDKRSIRVGTSGDCDVRYDLERDPEVGRYHAAVVMKENAYHILDLGQAGGVWVNGDRVQSQALRGGDRIRFGGEGGPEAEVAVVFDASYDAAKDAASMVEAFKGKNRETSAIRLVHGRGGAGGGGAGQGGRHQVAPHHGSDGADDARGRRPDADPDPEALGQDRGAGRRCALR